MAFYRVRSDGGNSVQQNNDPCRRRPAMHPLLRLSEDFLTDRGAVSFPSLPRMFFVVRGGAMVGTRSLGPGEACYSEDAVTVRASEAGATIWRWELSMGAPAPWRNGPGVITREKLSVPLETLPAGDLLWRGGSGAFPPGGGGLPHPPPGPGNRRVLHGAPRA